jgi:Zn-dependent protease with chaperone function
VTTDLILLVLATIAVLWVPGRLASTRWTYRSPWLAVVTWLAFGYTVLLAVVTVALTNVMHWHDTHNLICTAWRLCLDALTGAHGPWAQAAAASGLVLLLAVSVRIGLGTWVVSVVATIQRRRHTAMVKLVGCPSSNLGATIVPHPAPAVYVVPGRRPYTVITSGALLALDAEQTRAVLAHERAHCTSRHYLAVAAACLLARAFPWLRVYRTTEAEVRRLVELHADDLATRTHRPIALARSLVAMTAAPAMPAGALNGGGQYTVERLRRLLDPPTPLPLHIRSTAFVGLAILPVTPLLATALHLAVTSS